MRRARHLSRAAAALVVLLAALVLAGDLAAQALSPEILGAFQFRGIGPSRQSGRFVDVAVPPQEPTTIYMASGSGGLWKSVNNGITWTSIFDSPTAFAIGDLAVAPSNPNVIYLGTGEHTSSRSTYAGDGVYKSVDAGKTWVERRPQGQPSHRPHRRPPAQPRHRLRGGARTPLHGEPGARRVQERGRRQDLDEVARYQGRQQGDRRQRRRDRPAQPRHALRGDLRQGEEGLDLQPGGAGERHLQDDQRREDLDEADQRAALRDGRPHRPRHLPREPEHPLREHREREQAGDVGRRPPQGTARGKGERRDDRRGGLPHRRRREDVEEGEPRQAEDRRRPRLLLHAGARRSERREPRLRADGRRAGVEGRREDVGRRRSASAATTTRCGSTPPTRST